LAGEFNLKLEWNPETARPSAAGADLPAVAGPSNLSHSRSSLDYGCDHKRLRSKSYWWTTRRGRVKTELPAGAARYKHGELTLAEVGNAIDELNDREFGPYVYPGTTVVRNLSGLTDPKQLEQFEVRCTHSVSYS